MIHSGPKPLRVAAELTKRLHQDLSRHMTPEHRRDFGRLIRLIEEAERNHVVEVTRLHQRLSSGHLSTSPSATPTDVSKPARRRFLWV